MVNPVAAYFPMLPKSIPLTWFSIDISVSMPDGLKLFIEIHLKLKSISTVRTNSREYGRR